MNEKIIHSIDGVNVRFGVNMITKNDLLEIYQDPDKIAISEIENLRNNFDKDNLCNFKRKIYHQGFSTFFNDDKFSILYNFVFEFALEFNDFKMDVMLILAHVINSIMLPLYDEKIINIINLFVNSLLEFRAFIKIDIIKALNKLSSYLHYYKDYDTDTLFEKYVLLYYNSGSDLVIKENIVEILSNLLDIYAELSDKNLKYAFDIFKLSCSSEYVTVNYNSFNGITKVIKICSDRAITEMNEYIDMFFRLNSVTLFEKILKYNIHSDDPDFKYVLEVLKLIFTFTKNYMIIDFIPISLGSEFIKKLFIFIEKAIDFNKVNDVYLFFLYLSNIIVKWSNKNEIICELFDSPNPPFNYNKIKTYLTTESTFSIKVEVLNFFSSFSSYICINLFHLQHFLNVIVEVMTSEIYSNNILYLIEILIEANIELSEYKEEIISILERYMQDKSNNLFIHTQTLLEKFNN